MEEKPPDLPKQESPPQPSFAMPVPPAQTLPVAKTYICTLIPDSGDGPPEVFESDSLESLVQTMYAGMIRLGKGWCIPVINGERASVSTPKQVFHLKLANGERIAITDPESMSFEANGRFSTLSVKAP